MRRYVCTVPETPPYSIMLMATEMDINEAKVREIWPEFYEREIRGRKRKHIGILLWGRDSKILKKVQSQIKSGLKLIDTPNTLTEEEIYTPSGVLEMMSLAFK